MYLLTHFLVTFWAIANDYAWLATNPVANFALTQVNCVLPTPRCLRQAKMVHAQLFQEHVDAYWRGVKEELAQNEHKKQAKEAQDRYIAEQLAKGHKWDRWEVSPPTIIYNDNSQHYTQNNLIDPTLIAPTIVPACTAPSRMPGLDIKTLTTKYRSLLKENLTIGDHAYEESTLGIWIKGLISLFVMLYTCLKMISLVSKGSLWGLKKIFGPAPLPPPHSGLFQTPLRKTAPLLPSKTKKTPLHYIKTPTTTKTVWSPSNGRHASPVSESPLPVSGISTTSLPVAEETKMPGESVARAVPFSPPSPPPPPSSPPLPSSSPALSSSSLLQQAPEETLESLAGSISEPPPSLLAAESLVTEHVPDDFDLNLEDKMIAEMNRVSDDESAAASDTQAEPELESESEKSECASDAEAEQPDVTRTRKSW